jgi:hypothetical protein
MFPSTYSYDFEPQVVIYQTLHVQQRMAQRNISAEDLDFVLQYGKTYHRAGALHVHLRRCDISERWYQQFGRLEGTTAVLNREGTAVLTIHRNRQQGPRRIKKKASFGYKNAH